MANFDKTTRENVPATLPPGWGLQLTPMVRKLFDAVMQCQYKKLKYLLHSCSAKVTSKNEYGQTVLIVALHIEDVRHRYKMFRYLIKEGADPLIKDTSYNRNCLLWGCVLSCCEEVRYILSEYSGELDIAEYDNDGVTALHHAVFAKSMDLVSLLIDAFYKYRLSVDIPDRLGLTPYMQARRLGLYQIAQVLKDKGRASPHRRDEFNFKTGTEWSQIGRKEREKQQKERIQKEVAWIKMLGRAPKLHTAYGLPVRKRGRDFTLLPPIGLSKSEEEKESVVQSEPINDGKSTSMSNRSLPDYLSLTDRTRDDVQDSNKVTCSLIDMSENGRRVKQFHKSQTMDNSAEIGVLENISSLLDILVEQSSDSFRKSVEKPVVVEEIHTSTKKPKVSSLAIVMGRKRGDKSRKARPEKRDITRSRLSIIDEGRPLSKGRRGSKRVTTDSPKPTQDSTNISTSSMLRSTPTLVPEIKVMN